ncbi:hypothetical protein CVU37_02105 [candidate division BRC1 bacterium HGW-BRC1-1]|jgi:phosphatidylglycerophosphate synthase|nr:MAG: hypothetical protein CVU37_02105 [candidate division BRC1 bacterium HGW-BRC1-1]
MVRKRRDNTGKQNAATPAAQRPDGAATTTETAAMVDYRQGHRFGAAFYLTANLIFMAFCALQLMLVKAVIGETQGLYFFFGVLVIGFLLVSVFDYAYDRFIDSPSRETES